MGLIAIKEAQERLARAHAAPAAQDPLGVRLRKKIKIGIRLPPQPKEKPDRPCVLCGETRPSWKFINRRANPIARGLIADVCSDCLRPGRLSRHTIGFTLAAAFDALGTSQIEVVIAADAIIFRLEREYGPSAD